MTDGRIYPPKPEQVCTVFLKSGPHSGSPCGRKITCYNPVTLECYCKRHNKLTADEEKRILQENGTVLCLYEPPLRLRDDIDQAMLSVNPDPIGEAYIKFLNGYINWRLGYPFLNDEMPLVSMSRLCGYGNHFDRNSLAKCIKETIQYILTRPDAYTWRHGVSLDNLVLKKIWYDKFIGQYIVDLAICDD